MPAFGLQDSYDHPENGMSRRDMVAASAVANSLDEVIIFRSTGPWSKRWIETPDPYPTKNFHVKGKSSDWGPHAGFVPYNGVYSKVGARPAEAKKGTDKNDEGLHEGFAAKTQLLLTLEELNTQCTLPAGAPARLAIQRNEAIPGSKDRLLFATRGGVPPKEFAFRAVFSAKDNAYQIFIFPEKAGLNPKKLIFEIPEVLEVMTSSEVGAKNRPMTGDYDLMSICPRWANLNSRTLKEVSKPGLVFTGKGAQPGLHFPAGANLDKVLDMRSNTGARPPGGNLALTYQDIGAKHGALFEEHKDMGNLTPRILRCINALNSAMGAAGDRSAFRRVHHNAESHRNHIFGGITAAQMLAGDAIPLTVFQPRALLGSPTMGRYQDVSTLESLTEFQEYATQLLAAGYFVPRNWTWGMSIRDGFR